MANILSYDSELEFRMDIYPERIAKILDEKPCTTNDLAIKLSNKTDSTEISERIFPPLILALNALYPKYGSVGIIPSGDNDPLQYADEHIYGNINRKVNSKYAQKIEDLIKTGTPSNEEDCSKTDAIF